MKIIDHLFGFEGERLVKYIEETPINVGDEMMIYNGQGNLDGYQLVTVEAVNHGRQKRVIVSKNPGWGGRSFYRNGKNCFSPKGQSNLLPAIPCIKAKMGNRESTTVPFGWEPACFKLLQMVFMNDPGLSALLKPCHKDLPFIFGIDNLLRSLEC